MKIYFGHTKESDYQNELYKPIRNSELNKKHTFALPHEESDEPFNSKVFLKDCDLFIAEVSHKATGLGIELGWADLLNIPVICIYKKGCKPSSSLKVISNTFVEYKDEDDLLKKLEYILSNKKKKTVYKALVSAHIYQDEKYGKDIEILTQIDDDENSTDVFCDITNALMDEIDTRGSDDYYFMAMVEAEFVELRGMDYVEYDIEYGVTEIQTVVGIDS